MLDSIVHQGDGLRHAALHADARLIAVASQGQPALEQVLLWQLCQALQGYGYPPMVLDGTSLETHERPGLADLLAHAPCLPGSAQDADWTVMPAALGLRRMARERVALPPLARLARLLRGKGVVLLVAHADLLTPVLQGSATRPVLAVTPGRRAVLRGYRTIKQLNVQAALLPTLVAVARQAEHLPHARSVGRTLQECATTHLGCQLDMNTVFCEQDSGAPGDDMRRLALRLLEGAAALGEGARANYMN